MAPCAIIPREKAAFMAGMVAGVNTGSKENPGYIVAGWKPAHSKQGTEPVSPVMAAAWGRWLRCRLIITASENLSGMTDRSLATTLSWLLKLGSLHL